ncbi:hypothetical protein GQ457_12G000420 [Hibiscus cannabinus]
MPPRGRQQPTVLSSRSFSFKILHPLSKALKIRPQTADPTRFCFALFFVFTMMMSMFSSFEVLSSDYFGLNMKFTATPTEKSKPTEVSSSKKETVSKNSSPPHTSSSTGAKTPQKQRLRARFAPELDGVHCFETIIPY